MQSNYISTDRYRIHYLEHRPVDTDAALPTMVFLHGFPENCLTWSKQITFFGDRYRVIAPDLPGYHLSNQPQSMEDYHVTHLIEGMAEFIQQVNQGQPVVLVAHDWGGAIAWPLAAFHSQLVSKLVILNAAHPSTFTREMIQNPKQREKSTYIHQLIAADAEQQVANSEFALLKSLMTDENGKTVIEPTLMDSYVSAWQTPGALTAMFNYYRAMPQLAPANHNEKADGPIRATSDMSIPNIRVHVPTLLLWGEKDKAFVPQLLKGLEHYIPNLKVKRFPLATHWLHHEYPQEINQNIEFFLHPSN